MATEFFYLIRRIQISNSTERFCADFHRLAFSLRMPRSFGHFAFTPRCAELCRRRAALVHRDLVEFEREDLSLSQLLQTPADAGCELRGTAHWEGDIFVNDYEEVIDGKRTRLQGLWTDITLNSHTLTEAHDAGNGVMKADAMSHSTRQ